MSGHEISLVFHQNLSVEMHGRSRVFFVVRGTWVIAVGEAPLGWGSGG
jgi:hypothetical protein